MTLNIWWIESEYYIYVNIFKAWQKMINTLTKNIKNVKKLKSVSAWMLSWMNIVKISVWMSYNSSTFVANRLMF